MKTPIDPFIAMTKTISTLRAQVEALESRQRNVDAEIDARVSAAKQEIQAAYSDGLLHLADTNAKLEQEILSLKVTAAA